MCKYKLLVILVICQKFTFVKSQTGTNKPPHFIVITVDDLGWDDVSFHGSDEIPTPNIDALAYYGISLNKHYTPPMCTPTRGSFLTGKYPIHIGLQRFVIANDEPWGLGLDEKIIPQYLKDAGYLNYLVGKWHLGFFKRSYTPYHRGFDKFYGYLGAYTTYYNHDLWMLNHPLWTPGYDMRENDTTDWSTKGIYMTDLLTDKAIDMINKHDQTKPMFLWLNHLAPHAGNDFIPLEAPAQKIQEFNYISNPIRRKLAAVISLLDDSIGRLMQVLSDYNMLENSVVLFFSDNGAPSIGQLYNMGSNYPLKGQKDSPWESATRIPAAIWSPLLLNRERVSNQLIHISDWLPTFASLAGVTSLPINLDGINIWTALSQKTESPRKTIVHNIDDYVSYQKGEYKYIKGTRHWGAYDWWIGDLLRNVNLKSPYSNNYYDSIRQSTTGMVLSKFSLTQANITNENIRAIRDASTINCEKLPKSPCLPMVLPCLFNIDRDPCEHENLYLTHQAIASDMEGDILQMRTSIVQPRNEGSDSASNPSNFGVTWSWWQGEI